ncbi:hypothetical protein HXX76_002077 [Chlamydomonas incerta]|uniref:Uncharacterized protein n=1 Tax=Chlamydomonas incerta TaxID=51695 RepID=A0A835WAD4_CHLIN|nr:hypothetical protein HXX76_002077 [Chlamydomonas incerta]|eukprot:KAG2443731.1 hypothetical protein HXX76_002077 [Chlamydomonas incerta]
MHPGHRGQAHGGSRAGGARGRRSSSEELSEDPSWASGAESSEDEEDSGVDGLGSGSMRTSRNPSAQQQQQQQQSGVHITVVRRDADGRAVQSQPAAPPMLSGLLPLAGGPPLFQPPAGAVPGSSGRSVVRPRGSNGQQKRGSAHDEDGSEDPLACDEDASDGMRPQPRADSGSRQRRRSVPVVDEEEGQEENGGPLQQVRTGGRPATQEWDWGPDGHPGIAPLECRSSRSASVLQPALPPPLSGHVETPLGSLPVYLVAASSGGIMAARRRIAEQRKKRAAAVTAAAVAVAAAAAAAAASASAATPAVVAPAVVSAGPPAVVVPPRPSVAVPAPAGAPGAPVAPGATKDPLDLLAQAACEALGTPVPPRAGVPPLPHVQQPKEGAATTVPQEAVGEAMDCKEQVLEPPQHQPADAAACGPGNSEGSAHSGGGFAPPGCRGQSVPEAAPKLLPIKEEREQAGAAADDAQSSGQRAVAGAAATKVDGTAVRPAMSECVSASTQHSGGQHTSQGGQPAAQAPASAAATAQAQAHPQQAQVQAQNVPASPHSSAALLATDAVDWATTGDGDTEATGCTHAPKQDARPPLLDAAVTTSSVATAPSAATVALSAPAAAAAAHGRCPSAGATSDATGSLPAALAPLLTTDMSMNFAYMAAANAAAVNMATMAAAFLRAQPPLPPLQQPAPALPLALPVSATPGAPGLPGAPPPVPQPLGSVGSVMSSFLLPPPPPVGSLQLPPAAPAAAPPLLPPSTLPLLPPPLWHGMPTTMPPTMAAAVAAAPPLFQESPAAVLGAPAGCNQLLPVMRLFMASTGHPDPLAAAGAPPAPGASATLPDGTAALQLPPMPLPLPPVSPVPSALPTACAMPGCMPPPAMDMGLVGGGPATTQQHPPGFLMAARPLQPSR